MADAKSARSHVDTKRALLDWSSHISICETDRVGQFQDADIMSLSLAKHLVEIASNEGELILDPFGGVGTIGVAATQLGREFLGCEIDPKRYSIGSSNLPPNAQWLKGSFDCLELSELAADALITSPPFGRKVCGDRIFDEEYYDEMVSIFSRASENVRDGAIAVIELMNWPEFKGGGDLLFRFFEFLEKDWDFVREIVFTSGSGEHISPSASHTWLTIWMKKPRP